jgi:hypothetical protein
MYNLIPNDQKSRSSLKTFFDNTNGKVGVPILLYFLGPFFGPFLAQPF